MPASELDRLYRRVAECLAQDSLFVVHTYPNLWYYKYEYSRRLKLADQIGAYLPAEPRTRYELLMHINEQSPRVLKRQLSKYFPHVLVWFGTPLRAADNLQRRFSIQEMRAAPDLFAVASHAPIPVKKLARALKMEALPLATASLIKLKLIRCPISVRTAGKFSASVVLENQSNTDLKSLPAHPVHLSYHWLAMSGEYVVFGGERTRLKPDAKAGLSTSYEVDIVSPEKPGIYLLRITLVQEWVRWFDQAPTKLHCDLRVTCEPKAGQV
jgi:hypothetical protein